MSVIIFQIVMTVLYMYEAHLDWRRWCTKSKPQLFNDIKWRQQRQRQCQHATSRQIMALPLQDRTCTTSYQLITNTTSMIIASNVWPCNNGFDTGRQAIAAVNMVLGRLPTTVDLFTLALEQPTSVISPHPPHIYLHRPTQEVTPATRSLWMANNAVKKP